MAARQTRGRQKIPMRLIQNQDDLYASFSKRRLGLFKKASELSTLCGADVGILVFSPTDNPFSFFSPSMESVVDRYINPDRPLKQAARAVDFHARARIEALNKRLDEVMEQKLKLKEYDHQLAEADKARQRGWWEETVVDSLTKDQLREWTAWFETFKARLQNKVAQLQNGGSSSSAAALNVGAAAGLSSSMAVAAAPPPPYYASVADQFGGGQYFGVAMQDQAAAVNVSGGGGGGGVAQYLLSSPPLDPYYRGGFGGGGSSNNVFASQYRYYNMNAAEGGNPFAGGSSGGGGGGGGGSGQFVFSAAAGGGQNGQHFGGMVAPSSSGVNVPPPMNFCFTPTPSYDEIPSIVAATAAAAGGEEGGRGNSNQIQGRN